MAVAIKYESGALFHNDPSVFSDFNPATWVQLRGSSTLAVAIGPATTSPDLGFNVWFEGEFAGAPHPAEFSFATFYEGAGPLTPADESFSASWDLSSENWLVTTNDWFPEYREIVPVPAASATLLGIVGLGLVGLIRRRTG
jgi:hypothetical protein